MSRRNGSTVAPPDKGAEIDPNAESFVRRLLNRYGRFKYRYLLGLYQMAGLPAKDTSSPGGNGKMSRESIAFDSLRKKLISLAAEETNLPRIAELLSDILPVYLRDPHALPYFEFWQSKGFHITPVHYYHPVPDTRQLPDELWESGTEMTGIELNEPFQLELLRNVFPKYRAECDQIPNGPTERDYDFHFNNGTLDGMDARVLYSMVRHFKPDLVLEVGCGFSSRLIARAALVNGNTRLVCVDPFPDDLLKRGFPGLHTLLPIRVQDADFSLFKQLGANDILFIDSSHVVKCGGDVNYLFLEVLPRLSPGVIVHIHDIFLPSEVPRVLLKEKHFFWTEQYLLQAFLTFNSEFEVLFANEYMGQKHNQETIATFPDSPWWGGGSFWIRRKAAVAASSAGAMPYDAQFISQTTPIWIEPGRTFSVKLNFYNSGTEAWIGSSFLLASQNPALNYNWLGGTSNAVSLGSIDVPPGQELVVTRQFTAPITPGSYNFQWRLYQDGDAEYIGEASTNVAVQVTKFRDVPTSHPYYEQIERIAKLGITLGCDGTRYCADTPVTREQMAVFLERAMGVSHPPEAADQTFIDVPADRWSHAFIEEVERRGVTLGSGTEFYSPLDPIPLDQMVTLLERAVGRTNPPAPQSQRFVDVPPSRWSYAFVDSFVQHGLSKGVLDVIKRDCNEDGQHFCPDRAVTRAEMAALIVITFGL